MGRGRHRFLICWVAACFLAQGAGAAESDDTVILKCPLSHLLPRWLAPGETFTAVDIARLLPGTSVELTSKSGRLYRLRFSRMPSDYERRRNAASTGGGRDFLWALTEQGDEVAFYLDRLNHGRVVSSPERPPQRVEIDGRQVRHFGDNPTEHLRLLKELGLDFSHPVSIKNEAGGELAKYTFTAPFRLDGSGRVAAFALVETPGSEPTLRMFWRSNSHGVFRVMPAVKTWTTSARYDKGDTEHGLAVPREANRFLDQLITTAGLRPVSEEAAERLTDTGVRANRDDLEREAWRKLPDFISSRVKVIRLFGDALVSPDNAELSASQQVDYSRPVAQYERSDNLMGPVDVLVYRSRDGSLEYTFQRTKGEPAYARIADIQWVDSPINDLGVPEKTLDAGPLTENLWEHRSSLKTIVDGKLVEYQSGAPTHPVHSGYESQWNEVRQIPEIQRAYAAWKIPLPPGHPRTKR